MIIAVNKGTALRFLPKEECHRHEGSLDPIGIVCKLTLIAFFLAAPALQAQSSAAHVEAAPDEQHLRSRLWKRALPCWQRLTFHGKENKCKPRLPMRGLRPTTQSQSHRLGGGSPTALDLTAL
jgi:hypothetical protein